MAKPEIEDVKEESSSPEPESAWMEPEVEAEAEAEEEIEVEEEVEDTEESVEEATVEEEEQETQPAAEVEAEKPEPRVPLSRLRKEIAKRKAAEEKAALTQETKANETVAVPGAKPQKPTLEQLKYDEAAYETAVAEYSEALIDWKVDQREKARNDLEAKDRAKKQQQKAEKQLEEFYNSDEEYQSILKEVSDNEEDVIYPQAVAKAVRLFGPELDKAILKERATLLPELEEMSPEEQIFRLGELKATIGQKPKPKALIKKKSKAPAPVRQTPKAAALAVDVDGWKAS